LRKSDFDLPLERAGRLRGVGLREAVRSLPLEFVARPYSWPAQWHSRALSSAPSLDKLGRVEVELRLLVLDLVDLFRLDHADAERTDFVVRLLAVAK
jgi:hypothetical protein